MVVSSVIMSPPKSKVLISIHAISTKKLSARVATRFPSQKAREAHVTIDGRFSIIDAGIIKIRAPHIKGKNIFPIDPDMSCFPRVNDLIAPIFGKFSTSSPGYK